MTDALRDAWLNGRADRLGARGEAFAWALRKAWYAQGNGEYGLLKFVRENVSKADGAGSSELLAKVRVGFGPV